MSDQDDLVEQETWTPEDLAELNADFDEWLSVRNVPDDVRALLRRPPQGWQPIESAPEMRTILLFAVTQVDEHGAVKNWKMATGYWHSGFEDMQSKADGLTPWNWDGHQLKDYEVQPTHWMSLPAPPIQSRDRP